MRSLALSHRAAIAGAALAGASLLASSALQAQHAGTYADGYFVYNDEVACGTPGDGAPTPSFTHKCGLPPVGMQANGYIGWGEVRGSVVQGGALKAYAEAAWTYDNARLTRVYAQSRVSWWDRLTFGGEVPAYVRVTAQLHGTLSGNRFACDVQNGQMCGGIGHPPPPGPYADTYGWLSIQAGETTRRIYHTILSETEDGVQTLAYDFPVRYFDAPNVFDFRVTLLAIAHTIAGSQQIADFGNTAHVTGLRAVSEAGCDLADEGCDITDRVRAGGVTSASGTSYAGLGGGGVPTTTTPEPATVALLGVGLAGLGVAARRRAARSA